MKTTYNTPKGRRLIAYMKREFESGCTPAEVARDFNVHPRFLYHIKNGDSYADVKPAVVKA